MSNDELIVVALVLSIASFLLSFVLLITRDD